MKRHSVVKALMGPHVTSLIPAGQAQSTGPQVRRVVIQTSPLAGFQYHRGQHFWPYFRAGDALTLVREPTNPHDPKAVRIEWHNQKLGYVPRDENTAISQMLDRGERLAAAIERLGAGPSPGARLRFSVWLEPW